MIKNLPDNLFDKLGIGMQTALLVGIILSAPIWFPLWVFDELKNNRHSLRR